MADNIDITPGTGKTVATDDAGAAGHVQVVKLAISTDGSATFIPADAANGIDVDVTRLPGTVTEDAASAGAETLLMIGAVRNDAAASKTSADGDYSAIAVDAAGRVGIADLGGSISVDGTVTAAGGAAHDAAVSGNPNLIAAKASAAAPSDVSADGDVATLWALRSGALAVQATAGGALIGGDATNGLDVDVTRTSIEMTDNAGFTDGTSKVVPSGYILDETVGTSLTENDVAAARIDAKRAQVFVLEDQTTRGRRAVISASGELSTLPAGAVAHDAADSGNPIKVGARAAPTGANTTLVAVADRSDLVTDLDGALIVRPFSQLGDMISDVKTVTDGSSTAFSGSFAATANVRHYITGISMWNTSATTVTVDLRDGTAGSVIWTGIVPAGSGNNFTFNPPLRQPTVNTALAMDPSAAATTVGVSVSGFKSKA